MRPPFRHPIPHSCRRVARPKCRSSNSGDWKDIEAAKRKIPGDFLWFRQGGKAYVVQDAGVLAKVIDAWAPVDRLGDEMDGYRREMDQHGKVMEALGRDMEHAAGNIDRKQDRGA